MKIVLDATSIRDRPSGIGIYIQNLLTGMLEILREDDQIGFDLRILHKNKILWKFLNNQFLENQVKASHLLRFQGFYYPFPSEVSLQILRRSQWIKFLFENFFVPKNSSFNSLIVGSKIPQSAFVK